MEANQKELISPLEMEVTWERVLLSSLKFESGGRSEGVPVLRGAARLSSGRGVALFVLGRDRIKRNLTTAFALDHACYHHGGPLADGEIEEVPGVGQCVLCPWHKYLISIKNGEALYVGIDVDPASGKKTEKLKTKGIKQRAHPCRIVAIEGRPKLGLESLHVGMIDDDDEEEEVMMKGEEGRMDEDDLGVDDDIIYNDGTINPSYALEVLDMGSIHTEDTAKRFGKTVLRMFLEQRDQQLKEAKGGGAIQSDYYAPKPFNTTLAPLCEGGLVPPSYPIHSSLQKPSHLRLPPQA
jgi:nitrite reductase/ring-hydroxylating ferredoxin subunit